MNTLDFIISQFCRVDEAVKKVKKRKNANTYPSELMTIACLCGMKEESSRAFSRWLKRDYGCLLPHLLVPGYC